AVQAWQRVRIVGPKVSSFSGATPRTLRSVSRLVGAASVMLRRTVSEKMKKLGKPAARAASRRQSFRRSSRASCSAVSSGAGGGGGAGRLLGWTAEVWVLAAIESSGWKASERLVGAKFF